MTTAAQWLAKAVGEFSALGVPEAQANAEFLMAHVLKTGRNDVRLHSSRTLTGKQEKIFNHLLIKRAKRVPLAYILGTQPFMGLEIEVGPETLIPRPETEEVVLEAVRLLKSREKEPLHLLEIGTGTGCIAVALSVSLPNATIYATDISAAAMKRAQKNALAHHRSRNIRFIHEDLFKPGAAPAGWADLVISNPPYIPTAEIDLLEPEVLKEPRLALDGGRDGLDALRAIIASAPRYLKPGGWLVLEIGSGQGEAVHGLLHKAGLREIAVRKDIQGNERIAEAILH